MEGNGIVARDGLPPQPRCPLPRHHGRDAPRPPHGRPTATPLPRAVVPQRSLLPAAEAVVPRLLQIDVKVEEPHS
ncbi:unnamed protein product [Boreogadus saida]